MSASGPTQGAERHAASVKRWTSHPHLARLLRALIFVVPLLISFGFSITAGRVAPAHELGINRWLWITIVFTLSTILLVVLRRLAAQLIPLVALMKLTLVFPDNAPSRTKSALRRSNSRAMLREMEAARARGETSGAAGHGDYLIQLLKEVNEHDRLTRGHSERVRAYAELLGAELGLADSDLDKLRWAALLHDVGKLSVPHEILNKQGRPDDDEWKILSGHPAAGMPMLEPLQPWLGDWIHAADQHHCRWDGGGYPSDLAGTDITQAGRLVAIADAYDVMTSVRSYKKPLSPEMARQELTACAGSQFDPAMVRAFLQIGLGRLKNVAGAFGWVANLTGSAQLPVPAANVMSNAAWSAGVAATGLVTIAATGVLGSTPEPLALEDPVVALDSNAAAVAGEPIEVVLRADGRALVFSVGGASGGRVELAGFPERVGPQNVDGLATWSVAALYQPDATYVGEDGFSFEACDPDGNCDQGVVTIDVQPAPEPSTTTTTEATTTTTEATTTTTTEATITTAPSTTAAPTSLTTATIPNQAPTAVLDIATVAEDGSVIVAVLANDTDPDGDSLTVDGAGAPLHGDIVIVGSSIRYTPDPDYNGADQFVYTITDGINPNVAGTVELTVTPTNDPPVVVVSDASLPETAPVGSIVTTATATDVDDTTLTYSLVGDLTNRFSIDTAGVVRVAAAIDHENTPTHNIFVRVSDGVNAVTEPITITVVDVDEPPTAGADTAFTSEDTDVDIDIGANDSDPEGAVVTWFVPATSVGGGTLVEVDGTVTYTPPADFAGTDWFSYEAKDPALNRSDPAAVTITVGAVNDRPVAVADSGVGFSTLEDTSFTTASVVGNDSDVDDPVDPASITVVDDVDSGTLTDNGDGTFGYEPDADTNGTDSFQYTLTDPGGETSLPATVSIVVTAVNDPPTAVDDTLTVAQGAAATTIDLRLNDSDPEGGALTIVSVTDGTVGTVVDNGDGTATYTHDGSTVLTDTFTYTIADPGGEQAAGSVAVTVTTADADFDGVVAGDNCPSAYNPNQLDTDGDGTGDVCDSTPTNPASPGTYGTPGVPMGVQVSVAVATADFDGDGDMDLVYGNDGNDNQVWRNFGGVMVDSGQSLGSAQTRGVAVGDMDGDGSVDLVFASTSGAGNEVWLNDASATFSSAGTFGSSDSVAVGDVDGDGDLDAVFGNLYQQNRLWLNDGSGSLTDSGQLLGAEPTRGVAINDLNGDGFLDLSFSNDGMADTIWFNDGLGTFTDSGQALGIGRSHASALVDIDGDGDRDVVIAGDNEGDTVWLNDGFGTFTNSGPILGLGHSRAVDVGDIDGDGDLDLVFGDHFGANSVWLNNGSGVFNDSGQRLGNENTEGLVLVDTDGDGDLDVFAANNTDPNRAYVNF